MDGDTAGDAVYWGTILELWREQADADPEGTRKRIRQLPLDELTVVRVVRGPRPFFSNAKEKKAGTTHDSVPLTALFLASDHPVLREACLGDPRWAHPGSSGFDVSLLDRVALFRQTLIAKDGEALDFWFRHLSMNVKHLMADAENYWDFLAVRTPQTVSREVQFSQGLLRNGVPASCVLSGLAFSGQTQAALSLLDDPQINRKDVLIAGDPAVPNTHPVALAWGQGHTALAEALYARTEHELTVRGHFSHPLLSALNDWILFHLTPLLQQYRGKTTPESTASGLRLEDLKGANQAAAFRMLRKAAAYVPSRRWPGDGEPRDENRARLVQACGAVLTGLWEPPNGPIGPKEAAALLLEPSIRVAPMHLKSYLKAQHDPLHAGTALLDDALRREGMGSSRLQHADTWEHVWDLVESHLLTADAVDQALASWPEEHRHRIFGHRMKHTLPAGNSVLKKPRRF